jgi:hypothetical protein
MTSDQAHPRRQTTVLTTAATAAAICGLSVGWLLSGIGDVTSDSNPLWTVTMLTVMVFAFLAGTLFFSWSRIKAVGLGLMFGVGAAFVAHLIGLFYVGATLG